MEQDRVKDAHKNNFSDQFLGHKWQPYFRLMRLDRPVGVWLLLWPCFWGMILGIQALNVQNIEFSYWTILHHTILYFVGAVIMRGAGCAYNDLVDVKFDEKVERTKNRPLAAGTISKKDGKIFLFILLILGFLVLVQLNWFTIFLGASSLILIAIYPWMKRFTYWPQAFLGLTFNWGALLGFSALTGYIGSEAIFLYLAGFFWTIGYDTIYAHQDKDDDMMIGVKSTAILFGKFTKPALAVLYFLTFICLNQAAYIAELDLFFYPVLLVVSLHMIWQIYELDLEDGDNCLKIFKSNILYGLILTLTLLMGL